MINRHAITENSLLTEISAPATNHSDVNAKADLAVASGRLAEESGDTSEAMRLYSEAIMLNPNHADAYWRQAILFSRLQQLDEANAAFQKAAESDASNATLYTDYGYHLYLQERFVEAEEALRTAIRLQPEEKRAHNNLGLVLAATGREQEAVASFLDAGCSEADARSNLGFAQAMSNNLAEAQSSLQSALAIDPSLASSSKALDQVKKLVSANPQSGVVASISSTSVGP